jgi:hypothetical protein
MRKAVEHEMSHETNQADRSATDEWPTLAGETAAGELQDGLPFPEQDEEWAAAGSTRGVRLRLPVIVLVAFILVAAGFWGGAAVEKGHGSTASTGPTAALAARFGAGGARPAGGGTGAGLGTGGLTGGTTQGTTGTVSVVDGSTLYVLTTTGSLVKVTLHSSTAVTRNAKTGQAELRPGDSVVVQGSSAKNGTVTATSVAATAAGVTASGGGFGRGAGFGGAAPATGG